MQIAQATLLPSAWLRVQGEGGGQVYDACTLQPGRAKGSGGGIDMALDVGALRRTFELALERNPNLTASFYDLLFERYPQVKPLFSRNARRKQEEMLAQALVAVMDHLEDAPWLTQTLRGLGEKHKEYGVTREMYDWVGDALLTTLSEAVGPEWTPAVRAAWVEAYGAIVSLMN
jgi:hemoglobin-like flavoprotein